MKTALTCNNDFNASVSPLQVEASVFVGDTIKNAMQMIIDNNEAAITKRVVTS